MKFLVYFLVVFSTILAEFDSDYLKLIEQGPCNIPVVIDNDLSQEEFLEKYAYQSPVIIKTSIDRNLEFIEKTKIDNLLKEYGSKLITVGTANTYSYKKYNIRFDTYINDYVLATFNRLDKLGNETFYFFGDFYNYTDWTTLLNSYKLPHYSLPTHTHALSFGVAAMGTGVPFHFHGPGFAECIHGRKRWFLTEPSDRPSFNPDKSTLQWFLEDYEKAKYEMKLYECILQPGEYIYFPDKWWHATLNVDKAVFISTFLSKL